MLPDGIALLRVMLATPVLAVGLFLLLVFPLEARHESDGASALKPCKFITLQPSERRFARSLANVGAGETRTVRTIYFVPNDRS